MPNLTETAKVICPFWGAKTTLKINCSGHPNLHLIAPTFRRNGDRDQWIADFCFSYCWEGCPVAQAIKTDMLADAMVREKGKVFE